MAKGTDRSEGTRSMKDDYISRQAAIDAIKKINAHGNADRANGLGLAENAIILLPSAEPNPFCALADRSCPFQGKEFAWCLTCPHISEEDRTLVKKAVEPKTGRWILAGEQWQEDVDNGNYCFVCSECGKTDVHSKAVTVPYCWYCGAKMEGDKE